MAAGSPAFFAQSRQGEKWTAVIDTAYSITGDITVFPDHVVFQNGKSLKIAFVARVHRFFIDNGGKKGDSDVYRVVKFANPILLNDNTLCGRELVTLIAIARPAKYFDNDRNPRIMELFVGETIPTSNREPGYRDPAYCGASRCDVKQ